MFNPNSLYVDIDETTLPANTLVAVNAIVDPTKNQPGDGTVPTAITGQRYIILNDIPLNPSWTNLQAKRYDIIEYNGSAWVVSFDSSNISTTEYVTNVSSNDQLEWNGKEWLNSNEGVYNAGFWRLYL